MQRKHPLEALEDVVERTFGMQNFWNGRGLSKGNALHLEQLRPRMILGIASGHLLVRFRIRFVREVLFPMRNDLHQSLPQLFVVHRCAITREERF